jgi:hypothetical protein
MVSIDMCGIGNNYSLGQALGNERTGRCWAVEVSKDTPASLYFDGKYYRRFDTFKEAEHFALGV